MGCARWCLALLLMLGWNAASNGGAAAAEAAANLYQAKTRVTGQTAEGRGPAVVRCFTDVLVKVSGDPRLLDEPQVAELAGQAGALVRSFRYRDLMAGLPTNDEQGTRDRPYELTVDFGPTGIDAALAALGRRPWTAVRPRVVVLLGVRQGTISYQLGGDSGGAGMREALADAAERAGLRVLLPRYAAPAGATAWPPADHAALDVAAKAAGGDVALAGRLVWSEEALGWVARWQLADAGRTHRWEIRGVSFDDAFRNAMRGAAQVLSGNGSPGQ